MPFTDILTAQLFVLGISGLVLAYTVIKGILHYRQGGDIEHAMKSGQAPLTLLGLYVLISGLYGQFIWPLPGSYNILFYDIYPLWGMFLLASAWVLHSKLRLQYAGFFALLIGCMTILYGVSGYRLGLTSVPLALLGLYGLFGLAGILGYPVTLMFDRAQTKRKNRWAGWALILAVFLIVLILASLLAMYIGMSAIPVHLASPP